MSWYSGIQMRAHVRRVMAQRLAHRGTFASRLAWVSSTPLGAPVLPDVYWMKAESDGFPSGSNHDAPRSRGRAGDHVAQARDDAAAAAPPPRGARDGDEDRDAGVGQDGGLPRGVFLEPVEARGRVDRHRSAGAGGCRGTRPGNRGRWGA
jgi:hypothetical protein